MKEGFKGIWVSPEIRDKLQALKYEMHKKNVDEVVKQLL
jgi:hypothetical protein